MKYLWEHPMLYFHSKDEKLSTDKELISTTNKRQWNGIIFELTQYCLYIEFKPHYFFNHGLHNANDFKVTDCIKVLKEFISIFQLDPTLLLIRNIEFALNVVIPKELICVKELLLLAIYHERNQFYSNKKLPFMRYSTTVKANGESNVYKIIKSYAKGIQYPKETDLNTWRFEVKSNRKGYISKLGIHTYSDLLNPDIYLTLEETILDEFDKVLILDHSVTPNLTRAKLKTHKERLTQIYWHRLFQKSRNVFRTNFNKYYDDLNSCETHLKKELRKLIVNKLQELKKCAILNPYIVEMRTPILKECLLTGLDIAMQRADSKYLSNTGLKFLEINDLPTFLILKKSLLTGNVNKFEKDEYSMMSKQIRNRGDSRPPIDPNQLGISF